MEKNVLLFVFVFYKEKYEIMVHMQRFIAFITFFLMTNILYYHYNLINLPSKLTFKITHVRAIQRVSRRYR